MATLTVEAIPVEFALSTAISFANKFGDNPGNITKGVPVKRLNLISIHPTKYKCIDGKFIGYASAEEQPRGPAGLQVGHFTADGNPTVGITVTLPASLVKGRSDEPPIKRLSLVAAVTVISHVDSKSKSRQGLLHLCRCYT